MTVFNRYETCMLARLRLGYSTYQFLPALELVCRSLRNVFQILPSLPEIDSGGTGDSQTTTDTRQGCNVWDHLSQRPLANTKDRQ